ncbi:MAG: CoA transferase [Porticoccaceae bacterium]
MSKPLSGIKVLDLTHMLSGPYGTMILADLGAEIIKVEPLHGEATRPLLANDPNNSVDGMGAYFITLNRNKKSIAIDLKSPAGLELFYQLVGEVDVVFDNFSVGVTQKLRIDYAALKQINPRIISCSVTGFGGTGPGSKRTAFDQVVQAYGGGMSITGTDKAHPLRAGIPIGDLGGGMFGVMGVLAALYERHSTGVGQHVDISMLDAQISMLNYMATMYFLSGEDPFPIGNSHFVHVPYNTFQTQDGFIVIAVIFDSFWVNLLEVLDCDDLREEKYLGQPGRLADKEFIENRINEVFKTNTSAHWLAQLELKRIPCAPVNSFSQALSDEQVRYRNMVVDLKHPNGKTTQGPGNPIKLSNLKDETFTPAPLLGQNTDEILSELLNFTEEKITALRTDNIIG